VFYRRFALLTAPLLAAVAVAVPMADAGAPAGLKSVTISGTAYEFANVDTMLSGATIHILEDPAARATVAADGSYSIRVKNHAQVTPYITDRGYGTIYLQTFTTADENLTNVNFQTPTTSVMRALESILKIAANADGYPRQCGVVTTVNTKQVRGVSYRQLVDWGAHGVAGVTATISPHRGTRTYFNAQTIPDPTVHATTSDGGVVWTGLPAGKYTITAKGAGSRWPAITVKCAPGRVVNASPPWGMHQLATTVPTKVTATWRSSKKAAPKLTGLTVAKVPTQKLQPQAVSLGDDIDYNGVVTVSCAGRGCFKVKTAPGSMTGPVNLLKLLAGTDKRLRAGRTLTVSLAVPGYNTQIDSWKIPPRGTPKKVRRCIPLGDSLPRKRC
jgi:hypothetical protein